MTDLPPGPGTVEPSDLEPLRLEPAADRAPRRGRGKSVAIVLLTALLALAAAAVTYLWLTTVRWQDTSSGWEDDARSLGQDVARLQADLDGATTELTSTRDQLATAQDRIADLANEKAQLGDENVASQQYLDYQQRVSTAAGTVADALNKCTDGQAQLIGYLNERDSYDPDDLQRFSDDVDSLCQTAKDANDALQSELSQ